MLYNNRYSTGNFLDNFKNDNDVLTRYKMEFLYPLLYYLEKYSL